MKPVFLRQMVYVAMILVIPLASYFLIFKTRNAASSDLENDAKLMKAKSDKLGDPDKQGSILKEAKIRLEDHNALLKKNIDIMSARGEQEKERNEIYIDLQKMAAGCGLEASYVSTLRRDDEVDQFNSGFRRRKLAQMRLVGKFESFYAFLLKLEQQPDMLYPTDITITRLTGETNTGQVEVRLQLDYYYTTIKK